MQILPQWLRAVWDFLLQLSSLEKAIAAMIACVTMFYTIWNRLMAFYDRKVLRLMQEQQREIAIMGRGQRTLVLSPIPVALIARDCKRTMYATTKTLLRLERQGKAYQVTPEGDWLPGPRPTLSSLNSGPDLDRYRR